MLRANSRTLPIEDIKIPEAFAQTTPGRNKVEMRKAFYKVAGKFDKEIIVDRKCCLFDGYSAYIAAKELGLDKVSVVQVVPFTVKKKVDKSTEPTEQKEPIKLYCVENYGFFAKGKTYTIAPDGTLMLERGYCDNHSTFDDVLRVHPQMAGKIFQLVKRPAKVGEWVYITKSHEKRAVNGEIYEVAPYKVNDDLFIKHPDGMRATDGAANIRDSEYLVLDGYRPEPEPEKEPESEKNCKSCKKLCIINKAPVYAYCPEKKKVFELFQKDTRTDVCDDWSE